MKKKLTKALAMVLGVVLLVGASVFGTYAYLTSQDEVVNTFTVGNVKIKLDETALDAAGNEIVDAERVKQNTFKLYPGKTYKKDPTVTVVSGSEACWIFVRIVNEIEAIEGDNKIAAQLAANHWNKVDGTDNVYAYVTSIASSGSDQEYKVFDTVTIANTVDGTTLEGYNNKTIVVTAYAVQAEGFNTPKAAWDAANFAA